MTRGVPHRALVSWPASARDIVRLVSVVASLPVSTAALACQAERGLPGLRLERWRRYRRAVATDRGAAARLGRRAERAPSN